MKRPLKVGIIGGGQLCRMLAEANVKGNLGLQIVALDPNPQCPAAKFANSVMIGDYLDHQSLLKLAQSTDLITYEIEFTNANYLLELEAQGFKIAPAPSALKLIQDKLYQRQFLNDHNLPHPEFRAVANLEDLQIAAKDLGLPLFLKARFGSYDGKGNFLVLSANDFEPALKYFDGRALLAEAFVDFAKEISIIGVREISGAISTYPASENVHKESILFYTLAPARISGESAELAEAVARKVLSSLDGAGVFGLEMFLTKQGTIVINEIAPRVHNTGHYSIEASETSQFEQHLRAITGLPLGSTKQKCPAIMVNILGPQGYSGPYDLNVGPAILQDSDIALHMYDKYEVTPKRKMGHFTRCFPKGATITDKELEETLKLLQVIKFTPR